MPDPLTISLAAFAAIKKGIEIGKDLSQMSKDFGQLYDFIDKQKEIKKTGSKNDVLANYIAYEKAMDMERELTRIIQQTRGASGLRKFRQMQQQAKEQEKASRYAAMQRAENIKQILGITIGILIFVAAVAALVYFAAKYSNKL
tara:strand:+ start:1265 stop:1696 length:432 start_codon:yes stop_codon:yes gene_type:complete